MWYGHIWSVECAKLVHVCAWKSCHILFTRDSDCTPNTQIKLSEITFFDLVTLTFDLDHRTWLRYYEGASPYHNSCLYIKRFSRESAELLTDTHTHTHTHWTDSITSTTDAGGKNKVIDFLLHPDIRLHVFRIILMVNLRPICMTLT